MIRVYTASKIALAPFWHQFAAECPEVFLCSRWLKHMAIGTADTPENAKHFWQEDFQDVAGCDLLLCYATEGQTLHGALVEVGVALALGKPVMVIGEHPSYGTWQWHPGVIRVPDIAGAMQRIISVAFQYARGPQS